MNNSTRPFWALFLSKILTLALGGPASAWALHGGRTARPDEAPQVLRMVFIRDGVRKVCSGTRVGPRHVLTAAHCFGELELRGWRCLPLGRNILFANSLNPSFGRDDLPAGLPLPVEGVHIHPDVSNTGLRMSDEPFREKLDLAIVELARDLPASMPLGRIHYGAVANRTAVLMGGWGLLGHGSRAANPRQLQLASTRVWGSGAKKFHIGVDSVYLVHGDSGGPVLRASDGAVLGVNSLATPSAWEMVAQGTRDVRTTTGYDSQATPLTGMRSWVDGIVGRSARPECLPTGAR